jgi:ribonuclease VapC
VNGETIVIDSSAVVAMFKGEADNINLAERVASYKRRIMSTVTWFEAAMVCESASRGGELDFAQMISDLGIELIPFTPEQANLAFAAFKQFGKGRGKPAVLNFGDCFAYALAKETNAPLLFKGNDFSRTDIAVA